MTLGSSKWSEHGTDDHADHVLMSVSSFSGLCSGSGFILLITQLPAATTHLKPCFFERLSAEQLQPVEIKDSLQTYYIREPGLLAEGCRFESRPGWPWCDFTAPLGCFDG